MLAPASLKADPATGVVHAAGDWTVCTLDAVQEYFHAQSWSDGTPVVPPTIDRVERFLKFTDRKPSDVLGVLPPANRQATVWNVADRTASGARAWR